MRSLWLDSTHPLEYRARSTTLLAALFLPKVSLYKFTQKYFIGDENSELATRFAIMDGLKPDIIRGIN